VGGEQLMKLGKTKSTSLTFRGGGMDNKEVSGGRFLVGNIVWLFMTGVRVLRMGDLERQRAA
jgi:hypothetical protein